VLGLVQAAWLGKKTNTLILFGLALQAKGEQKKASHLLVRHIRPAVQEIVVLSLDHS